MVTTLVLCVQLYFLGHRPNPAHKPTHSTTPTGVIAPQPTGDVHHFADEVQPSTLRASIVREESSLVSTPPSALRQCDSLQCRWVVRASRSMANQCLLVTHVELF